MSPQSILIEQAALYVDAALLQVLEHTWQVRPIMHCRNWPVLSRHWRPEILAGKVLA